MSDELKPLEGKKCKKCGSINMEPVFACTSCSSDELESITLSGKGKVYTYTIVHMGFGELASKAPYPLVILELEEGAKVTSIIEDVADPESVKIGDAVVLSSYNKDNMPVFKLAS